jgi:hypothetical protein
MPPQMRSTSDLISCSGRMGSFEPLTASMRSWRRGLMAMPRSVTTTSINSPGPHKCGHLIDDDRNAVAKRRHGQDGAPCGQTVLPAADAVQQASVGVGDNVGVEVRIDFGRAQHDGIHEGREVSFPVVVVRSERRSRHVARIVRHRLHAAEIERLPVENVIGKPSSSSSTRYLVEPPRTNRAFTPASFIIFLR